MGDKRAIYKIFRGKKQPIQGTLDVLAEVLGVKEQAVVRYTKPKRLQRVEKLGGRGRCSLPVGYKVGEVYGDIFNPSEFFVLLNGKKVYMGTLDKISAMAKAPVETIEQLIFEPFTITRGNSIFILEIKPRWQV